MQPPQEACESGYLDTAFLQRRSVRKVTDLVLASLDAILAVGTLEIVVADANPRAVSAVQFEKSRS